MSAARNQAPVISLAQLDEMERLYPGDLLRGYRDGMKGLPWPSHDVSPAYEIGRRNAINDRAGTADPEQRLLARA